MLLLACPACDRQYDATGLEPGALIRCACDRVFDVGWPKQLTGQALTCTNCGGAVSVKDESCSYCKALISEEDRRKTTLCPACFTRIDDDSKHCRACALEIRPQALKALPADRACPRCQGKLRTRALDHEQKVDVIECGACLGIWLIPNTFDRTLLEAERESFISTLSLTEPPKPSKAAVETVAYLPCLNCGELMNRRQYRYAERSSGVVIDHCRQHGVWLDHEELERIIEFIRSGGTTGPGLKLPDPKAFIPVRKTPLHELRRRRGGAAAEGAFMGADLLFAALEGISDLIFFEL